MPTDEELTEEEQKSIEDYENRKSGITEVKSRTGNKFENSCYGK